MRLKLRLVLVLAATMGGLATRAHAQYFGYDAYPGGNGGYGGYGWGGWGGTIQGDAARGLGALAVGEGRYNLDTAAANQINAQTAGAWNQYMFISQMEANRRERIRLDQKMKRDSRAGDLVYQRLRTAPTPDDVGNGAALNVALDQLTDPRIHSSALRLADAPIPGKVVRTIPFSNATDAVTISLNQLTAKEGWPLALRGAPYGEERLLYQNAVARALKEDEEGDLSPETIQGVQAAALRVRAKLYAALPADPKERAEAQAYVRTLVAMSQMLEKPRVDKILAELDSIKKTSLGSLLAFMHTFNLRFAPATTPEQRAVYEQLYPLLAEQRDRIVKEAGLTEETPPRPMKEHPTNFFSGLHLEGTKKNAEPKQE